jgi:tetratricopeptide (TPR) repeat protein/tRNA A-37 threonylcarbamoyl transferase component Bud32
MNHRSFGNYTLTQLLGRTGTTEVYIAHDPTSGREVVIRTFPPELANEPNVADRFNRAAQQAAALKHPHIIPTYAYGIDGGRPFLVTEYLQNGSLRDRLMLLQARNQSMALEDVARIVGAVADALDYAHDQDIVHGNVRPTNILFTDQDTPALGDFGVAAMLEADLSGSPATAPAPNAAADIDALAKTLYEMVCGVAPSVDGGKAPVLARQLNPALSEEMEAVLVKALSADPAARFRSAGALARAVRRAVAGTKAAPIAGAAPAAVATEGTGASPSGAAQPGEASNRNAGWMVKLATVTDVVAPLAGRKAPLPEQVSQDWRGRLAFVFGVISVLFAVLQFTMTFFNFVWTPLAPLVTNPLYLIASALTVSAVFALYARVRATTPRRRRRAAQILAATAGIGVAWGAWFIYDYVRPPSGIVIAIGEFDGRGATQRIDFARRIDSQLAAELQDVGVEVEIKRTLETYADAMTARTRGARHKANLVIWGWYDDLGVSPHVEVLRLPTPSDHSIRIPLLFATAQAAPGVLGAPQQPMLSKAARLAPAPASLPELKFFAEYGPESLANITAAIVGMALFADGDLEHALVLLNKSLSNPEGDAANFQGQELVYFERANVLFTQRKYAEAVRDLEAAIRLMPDFYEAHYNLAIAYTLGCNTGQDLARAIAEAKRATELQPDNPDALRLLGQLYQQAGDFAVAVTLLEQALQHGGHPAQLYTLLASAYRDAGRSADADDAQQRAITLWEEAIAGAKSVAVDDHLNLGNAYLAVDRYADALAQYDAAQLLAPADPRVQYGIGSVYYWQGRHELAEQSYRAWIEMAPEDATPHLLLGLLYSETQEPEQAIAEFQQAASLSTCDATPHRLLGSAYLLQGNYAAGEQAYRAALEVDPHNADSWYLLGIALYWQDRPDEAIESLTTALDRQPEMVQARYALASAYLALEEYASAAAELEQVVAQQPDEPSYYVTLASAYEGLERWDDALAAYQKSLKLQESSDVHIYVGTIYMQQQEYAEATAEFEKAAALDPTNTLAYFGLGNLYSQVENYEEAIRSYQSYLEREESAQVRTQLANAYAAAADLERAVAEFERALALAPQEVATELALANVLVQLGRLSESASHYNAALAIEPANAGAFAGLGQIEYKRCKLEGAIDHARSALAAAPNNSIYLGQLAVWFRAQGVEAEAEQIFQRLRDAPPTDVFAHLFAGDDLSMSGDEAGAARELELALDHATQLPAIAALAHASLGQLAIMQDKLNAAEEHFRLALAAHPAQATAQLGLGDVALRRGDLEAALLAYGGAPPLLPGYGRIMGLDNAQLLEIQVYIRRAIVYRRLSQLDEAERSLAQALLLAEEILRQTPQWPAARFALALVYGLQGETQHAETEHAAATACDRSLENARAVAEDLLAKLQ